ncbi:ABC transporter ATP-binding protein/permease [Rossellomorea aquimaris]|uniref:ABC transporter ATP-binding protein n=1 Tax=Rossellomorea aquimaris TaxID=189382 RepID=UPI001CD6E7D6|nr:ABC transporter ATP-binding protein [Rossellomorea aquimaris]MCA1061486.1 ABC transporter ATP-binding protein/permease [Rossellomorea aquimaris]
MNHLLYFTKRFYAFSGKVLIFNLIGMMLISMLEGVGILLLIPMLTVSGFIDYETTIAPISKLVGFIALVPEKFALPLILVIYIFLVISQALLQRNISRRNVQIRVGFINHLRMKTYRELLQANWGFFLKKRKSDLINSLTAELGRVNGGTNMFLQLITSIIFTLLQLGIAFWVSPYMTGLVLISGIILAFVSQSFVKKSKKIGSKTSEIGKNYLAGITDNLNGIKDIKSNSLEHSRNTWLSKLSEDIIHEQTELIKIKTNSNFLYKVSSAIIIALFIYFSITLFRSQADQFLLVILIFTRLWPRFTSIQSSMEQLAETLPAFSSVIQLQRESREANEIFTHQEYQGNFKCEIRKNIKCVGVNYRYNSTEPHFALENINVTLPANKMTAIVGPSGAGKSTLVDLLMGLNVPEHGSVLVDGLLLSGDVQRSIRSTIGYVPQEPFLFNASIRENLLIMKSNATDWDIWEALQFSSASEFVKNLPEGLDTLIGDRGIRLSGGERQRIVLARAILRKPSILVLDEATSALDSENEAKIQEAIERLKGKMTIIVIAHRLSTIRNADQVIVLDKGRVVQTGGFNQLANEKKSMFSNLLEK